MEPDGEERWNRALMSLEEPQRRRLGYDIQQGVLNFDASADIPPEMIIKHLAYAATRDFGYNMLRNLMIKYGSESELTRARIGILSAFARKPALFPDERTVTMVELIITHLKAKTPIPRFFDSHLREQVFSCLYYIGENPIIFPSKTIFFVALWSNMFTAKQNGNIRKWTCTSLCEEQCSLCDQCLRAIWKSELVPRQVLLTEFDKYTLSLDSTTASYREKLLAALSRSTPVKFHRPRQRPLRN